MPKYTSSTSQLIDAALRLFDRIINKDLNVRRVTVTACKLLPEDEAKQIESGKTEQLSFFDNPDEVQERREQENAELEKERKCQETILQIRKKYGKNAILKGVNYEEGATTKERNGQIGGHKA